MGEQENAQTGKSQTVDVNQSLKPGQLEELQKRYREEHGADALKTPPPIPKTEAPTVSLPLTEKVPLPQQGEQIAPGIIDPSIYADRPVQRMTKEDLTPPQKTAEEGLLDSLKQKLARWRGK